ncbi:MAG: SHOCT domain-containing protein [Actinomycetota bacterium]|nr:SHOCT domain-containing protein [Actinomycetota bacterium]
MMWGNYAMGFWGWGIGAVVIVGLVIAGIFLVRYATAQRVQAPTVANVVVSTPRQILDSRLAKGELSVKDYQDRLAALDSPRG